MDRTRVRRPAVAGQFYPARREEAEAALARLVVRREPAVAARALVVPHAGWMYSGRVAGEVYGRVTLPRHVVVLGPNHTGLGAEGSVMARGRWAVPGGEVPVAEDLAEAILAACPLLVEDEAAHREEHAIEVQLPFLRWIRPDVAFVPVTLMRTDAAFCGEVGRGLARALRGFPGPVALVCSTDLNHYEPQAVSNRKDRLAIEALLALDPARLQRVVREHRISMCGIAPATATLVALQALDGATAELVRYETSGDVSGDLDRVVGYAGIVIR